MRLSLISGAVLFLGAVGACADDGGDDDTSYNCAEETRDDEFAFGLTKPGESSRIEFKLLSSEPAPPHRGDNTWIVQLDTMTQPTSPVTGAVMSATPFMPDHAHGSGKSVVITPMTEPGQYKLEPVNMWMPGLWEVTMQVTGANSDRVVFRFCLPS
jgi:hypothetical protein